MNRVQKLLVISGMTGVGKSTLAYQVAKQLRTKIVVGDALQVNVFHKAEIYNNWPIASNFPPPSFQKDVTYLGLGRFDVNEQQLTTVDFRTMITEYLANTQDEVIVLEGGSCFYLDYLLKSRGESFTTEQIKHSQSQLEEMLKANDGIKHQQKINITYSSDILLSLCPTYDNSINPNDTYRLEKAIRYALLTNGKSFIADNFGGEGKSLRELYDVRGVFLYAEASKAQKLIDERCENMLVEGYLKEYLTYMEKPHQTSVLPIGYKEAAQFTQDIAAHARSSKQIYISQADQDKYLQSRIREFVSIFSTRTRQYASYQRKYFRQKIDDFIWMDHKVDKKDQVVNEILSLSRAEYDTLVMSPDNQRRKMQTYTTTENKNIGSAWFKRNLMKILHQVKHDIVPLNIG